MSRVYNFSAGPAVLPESVLQEAAAEMLDYRGTGMSVMEMSHRSKTYQAIIDQAEADLRTLMGIPDNYKVLFMQGGASQQFAMVPMNLMKTKVADYIITGQWAKKAWLSRDPEVNPPPGGESGEQMKRRVLAAYMALESRKENTVIVTHGGVIAAIMASLFPEEGKNRYQWQPKPGEGYAITGGTYSAIP